MTPPLLRAADGRRRLPWPPRGRTAAPSRRGAGADPAAGPARDRAWTRASLPAHAPPALIATALVIATEVMLFAGLVFGFWVLRLGAPLWPPPLQPRLPVAVTGANTLVLLASALAMLAALGAAARGDRRRLVSWLGVTAGLGMLFLGVQGYEWVRLVRFGLTVSSGLYGATFYTLVGAHALHVAVAVAWIALLLAPAARGRLAGPPRAALLACAAYWGFVVALWPVLYVSVYLA